VEAVRGELKERHRDVLDLLLLAGARPGELLKLTTGMIERSGEIWRVPLKKHENAKRKRAALSFSQLRSSDSEKVSQASSRRSDFPVSATGVFRDDQTRVRPRECRSVCPAPIEAHVATKLTDDIGLEAAQHLLGHSKRAMTEHYARAAERQAIEAAKRLASEGSVRAIDSEKAVRVASMSQSLNSRLENAGRGSCYGPSTGLSPLRTPNAALSRYWARL
jgi:integrase